MTRTQRDCPTPVQCQTALHVLPQSELRKSSFWIRGVVLFLALGCIAILAASASGQAPKYDVLKVEQLIDDNLKTVQREARNYAVARDISAIPANKVAVVQRYWSQYVPAKITQPNSYYMINDVMGHARSTMTSAVRSRTPGAANVMRWLYGGLKPIAVGNYHPAARINAIQFIARLAKPPAQRGGIPQPYSFVLADMKSIYADQKNSDAVRAAALQGIERFVRYTPSTDTTLQGAKAELTQEMTQLLQSDAPAGRDPLAHAFLQRYAVNILTNLSADASFGKELVNISISEDKPNLIALHSAAAIARLPGKMAEGDVETKKVLMEWSKRILRTYEAELARFNEMEVKLGSSARQPAIPESYLKASEDPSEKAAAARATMMGSDDMMMMEDESYGMDDEMDMMEMEEGMGMEEAGMFGSTTMSAVAKQPAEIVASRRKLNHAIQQVLIGLMGEAEILEDIEDFEAPTVGLLASAPADSLEETKEWLQAVFDMTTQLNDKTVGNERAYKKVLEEQLESLTALAEGKSVEPKAAGDVPIFGFEDPLSGEPAAEGATEPAVDPGLEALLN